MATWFVYGPFRRLQCNIINFKTELNLCYNKLQFGGTGEFYIGAALLDFLCQGGGRGAIFEIPFLLHFYY